MSEATRGQSDYGIFVDQPHTGDLIFPVFISSVLVCILNDAQRIDPQVCIPKKPCDGYSLCEGLVEIMAFERETSLKVLEVALLERNELLSTPAMAQGKILQVIGNAGGVDKPSSWSLAVHRHVYESFRSAFLVDSVVLGASAVMTCTLINPSCSDMSRRIVREDACRDGGCHVRYFVRARRASYGPVALTYQLQNTYCIER